MSDAHADVVKAGAPGVGDVLHQWAGALTSSRSSPRPLPIMLRMRAVMFKAYGPPEVLTQVDLPNAHTPG